MCSEVDQQVAKANSHTAETSLIPGINIGIFGKCSPFL